MKIRTKLGLITTLLAGCAFASASFAGDWSSHHFDRPPESHGSQASPPPSPPPPPPPEHHSAPPDVRGAAPSPEFRGAAHTDLHGQVPPRDFRGAPPDFRGQLPSHDFRGRPPDFQGTPNMAGPDRATRTPRDLRDRPRETLGGGTAPRDFRGPSSGGAPPPAVSAFVERHDVSRFTPQQREAWTHGSWHHTRHHGRLGWWWFFNDSWFFYPEPFYPYPTYVGDYYDDEYASDDYWYWCDEPRGYYPYVQECDVDWVPVPPQPY